MIEDFIAANSVQIAIAVPMLAFWITWVFTNTMWATALTIVVSALVTGLLLA